MAMDDSTRDSEPGGWESEREEEWLFDLPEGARERQESKNRDLRERLLQNMEEARRRRLAPPLEGQHSAPQAPEEEPEPGPEITESPDTSEPPGTPEAAGSTDVTGPVDTTEPSDSAGPDTPAPPPPEEDSDTSTAAPVAGQEPEAPPADTDDQLPRLGDMPLLRRRHEPTDPGSPEVEEESASIEQAEEDRSPFAQPEHQSPLADRWADLLDDSDQPGSIVEGMRAWVEKSRARNKATRKPLGSLSDETEEEPAASAPVHPEGERRESPEESPSTSVEATPEPPSWESEPPASDSLVSSDEPATASSATGVDDEGGDSAAAASESPEQDREWDPSPIEHDDWGGEVIGESILAGETAENVGSPLSATPTPEVPDDSPTDTKVEQTATMAAATEEPTGPAEAPAEPEPSAEPTEEPVVGPEEAGPTVAGPTAETEEDAEVASAEDDGGSDQADDGDAAEDDPAGETPHLNEEFPWKDPHGEESVLVRAFNAHAETANAREAASETPVAEPSFSGILGEDAEELLAEVSGRREQYAPGAEDWGGAYSSSMRLSPSDDVLFRPSEPPVDDEFDVDVTTPEYLKDRNSDARSLVRNIVETGLLAILVFLAVRVSFQNFRVDGTSMSPTLADGEFLLVNKLVYSEVNMGKLSNFLPFIDAEEDEMRFVFHGPHRGDIVVLRDPRRPEQDLIKRVIGLPGETVEILNGKVYINGFLLREPYIQSRWNDSRPKIPIPEGQYYVLGDNRNNSLDSRSPQVGLIPKSLILGKALLTYWPFGRFGLAPNSPGTSGGPELTTARIPLAETDTAPPDDVPAASVPSADTTSAATVEGGVDQAAAEGLALTVD
ncbi:MAG: signal peptidase I [Dehalococcoidia bacterium]